MSRTDKTRPLTVRMLDAKDSKIGIHEYHNHVKGYCDLPPRDPKAVEEQHDEIIHSEEMTFGKACHYGFAYKGSNMCGCKMCTGQDWRKEERRAKRHNAKTSLHNHKKAVNSRLSDIDDLDEDLNEELAYLEPEADKVPSVTW